MIQLILLLVNFSVVFCAPQGNSSYNSDINTTEEVDKVLSDVESTKNLRISPLRMIESVLQKSINKTCVVDDYKEHKMTERVPDVKAMSQVLTVVNMVMFSTSCLSKTDFMIKFVIEMFMSYHYALLELSIHDPKFKNYSEPIMCADNFEFKNKIIDLEKFPVNATILTLQGNFCEEMEKKLDTELKKMEQNYQPIPCLECTKEILELLKKNIINYTMLIHKTEEHFKKIREKVIKYLPVDEKKLLAYIQKH